MAKKMLGEENEAEEGGGERGDDGEDGFGMFDVDKSM